MVAKIILIAGLIAAVTAQYAQYPNQYVRPGAYYDPSNAYPDTPAKYQFAYEVADPQYGDYHGHQEARDGDVVQGVYFLGEADGTRRIVEYTADGNGFNAVVRKEGQQNANYNQGAYVQPAYRPAAYRPAYRPNYRPAAYNQGAYAPAAQAQAYRNYKK
uniref:Pupal cuticle protein Edg-84A n=1 Tax=Cacopsylla melanoneura TaxID=428564 RepID=A0A8D8LWY6_9HEMI